MALCPLAFINPPLTLAAWTALKDDGEVVGQVLLRALPPDQHPVYSVIPPEKRRLGHSTSACAFCSFSAVQLFKSLRSDFTVMASLFNRNP